MWSFELVVLLSGLLPNPKLETSVLSIRLKLKLQYPPLPLGYCMPYLFTEPALHGRLLQPQHFCLRVDDPLWS